MRSIEDAVHTDLNATEAVYNWVVALCLALGAKREDLVPFEKYANAALSLRNPSSAARALAGARLISNGSTAWCKRSRRSMACSRTSSTKRLDSLTSGWRRTGRRLNVLNAFTLSDVPAGEPETMW